MRDPILVEGERLIGVRVIATNGEDDERVSGQVTIPARAASARDFLTVE